VLVEVRAAPTGTAARAIRVQRLHVAITVWARQLPPVFDNSYVYRSSLKSKLAMDVAGSSTGDGATVLQYAPFTDRLNQQFKIIQTASSTWKLLRCTAARRSSAPAARRKSGQAGHLLEAMTDVWGIDDHNGHFKVTNKSSANALESPITRTAPPSKRPSTKATKPGLDLYAQCVARAGSLLDWLQACAFT